ncbi:lycopene cyclase domain-containing protein [Mycobacterium sp. MMS18-G62]
MDRWQYVLVLAACLAVTAPLEIFGSGVYRQVWRTAAALFPVAVVFAVWDVAAIVADVWAYNPRYVTGIELLGSLPIEELLFFVVIPLCGLLTYNAVDTILAWARRKNRTAHRT